MRDYDYAIVIPARYKSTRLPGKPLLELLGKPMIQHVWEKCVIATDEDSVYIATDDERIYDVVEGFGGKAIMTSPECLTGTDRVAEANKILKKDFIINVQGDEPAIEPSNIIKVIEEYKKSKNIINAMTPIKDENEYFSLTIPKVVTRIDNTLLYMSRTPIPSGKKREFKKSYKQVCIYAFGKEHLDFFIKENKKTPLEESEDIEILRFLESGFDVSMLELSSSTVAVDVPDDIEKVLKVLKNIMDE